MTNDVLYYFILLPNHDTRMLQDPVLKNKENFYRHTYSHEDNFYYNISGQAFEQETRENNNSLSNENLKKSSISVGKLHDGESNKLVRHILCPLL